MSFLIKISVDKKIKLNGFGPWTIKQNQFSVQPPLKNLEDNFTGGLDKAEQGVNSLGSSVGGLSGLVKGLGGLHTSFYVALLTASGIEAQP